jgi:hypothetical protein
MTTDELQPNQLRTNEAAASSAGGLVPLMTSHSMNATSRKKAGCGAGGFFVHQGLCAPLTAEIQGLVTQALLNCARLTF